MSQLSLILRPPRFYLAAVEKNWERLQDKIWEWPGDEASLSYLNQVLVCFVLFLYMSVLEGRWRKKGRAGREDKGKRGEEKGIPLILRYCATRPAMCMQQ